MTAPVLDGPRESGEAGRADVRTCPECLTVYTPKDDQQLFCSTPHRRAWNNRWTVRGGRAMVLAAVARVTRNGSRCASDVAYNATRAGRDLDAMLRQWRADDASAGRMTWEQYNALRYRSGFDPL